MPIRPKGSGSGPRDPGPPSDPTSPKPVRKRGIVPTASSGSGVDAPRNANVAITPSSDSGPKEPASTASASLHEKDEKTPGKAKSKKKIDPSNLDENGDYIIGRGRTPRHTRFPPGQSGNPAGKKAKTLNADTEVLGFLEGDITVRTSKGPETMSKMRSLLHKLFEQAIKGDRNAAVALLNMYRAASDRRAGHDDHSPDELTPEEQALLDILLNEVPNSPDDERNDDDEEA